MIKYVLAIGLTLGLFATVVTTEAQAEKAPKGYRLVEYTNEAFDVKSCSKKGQWIIIIDDADQKQVLKSQATYFRDGFLVKSAASCDSKIKAREIIAVYEKVASGIAQ